jgi:hypothetical protein
MNNYFHDDFFSWVLSLFFKWKLKVVMDIRDLAFIESHYIKMMFLPTAWDNAENIDLEWININFPPLPRSSIPKEPGVYAFVVEPSLFSLEPASGLFYIGKATNLYNRISAYIGEQSKDFSRTTRPHIWRMLNQWKGHLKYYYSITNTVEEAENIEELMIKALRPHFNKQYDAETSQVMRAF